eukprot:CAMPEP_0183399192 /NCGR_PEP_ID=MMETSP0370-20130417/11773_1 /TAXON_ID=268820 /ORGANISM="Peridinium aciculiferum, Strain PAER-2" /LENGTH=70 /DNA_ID=CAMNT_0025580311 /DNA_START=113 /DNA_END=320 /DNA_ORIENTATION=+
MSELVACCIDTSCFWSSDRAQSCKAAWAAAPPIAAVDAVEAQGPLDNRSAALAPDTAVHAQELRGALPKL